MEQPVKRIADYVLNDVVTAFFAVRRADVREFTRGQFLRIELGDSSGRIPAVWWDPDHFALTELAEGMVVKVKATVTEYNSKLQLTVEKLRLAKDDEYAVEDILPHSKNSYDDRKQRILRLTEKIENSYTRSLAMSFWEDEAFFHDYLMAAAGKLWHHAYVGGLADHSANIAELTQRVAQGYDFLDRDLLMFGGLFHDAGKVDTYRGKTVIDYTDEGRLVGHICLCDHWIAERASKIEDFPDKLLIKLRHMILAHQGELQYATPVVPQIPEAFVLYYCDEIDSKMGAIERIRDKQGASGWSEYINLLGRHLYFGDEPPTE
jgi:3'-5' exoribonuclease